MAKYKAIIEIDLEDDDSDLSEVEVIEEAVFQATTEILDSAGYTVTGVKTIVLFQGEEN